MSWWVQYLCAELGIYMPALFQILIKSIHCSPHLAQTFTFKVMADNLWIEILVWTKVYVVLLEIYFQYRKVPKFQQFYIGKKGLFSLSI